VSTPGLCPGSLKLQQTHSCKGPRAISNNAARVAFIPFSTGPRGCVGKPLAMKELTLTLARILRNLDFETVEGAMGKLGEGGDEYQLKGGFTAGKEGPVVQSRRRVFA
jgi:cytochrome P450